MQAAFTALPEFEVARHHAESAPEGRQGDFAFAELSFHLIPFHFEDGACGDDAALRGHPGGELGAEGALHEVGQDLGGAGLLGDAVDGQLPLQGQPGEEQRDVRIRRDLFCLAAFEIGEEHEPPIVPMLQQHRPGAGPAGFIHRRHRHGVRLEQPGLARLLEPESELVERIGPQVLLVEAVQRVIHTHGGQLGFGGGRGHRFNGGSLRCLHLDDIVGCGLALAGGGDADEAGLGAELGEVDGAEVAHA